MLEKIYNKLINLYDTVKHKYGVLFLILFICSAIFKLTDKEPDIVWILWAIVGGLMVIFGITLGVVHLLLGNKLKGEGKLDEEGNYREDMLD